MRRISLIAISILIVVGLGTGTYAYVAYDRGLWPFETKQSPAISLSGNFPDLLSDQTAIYAYLDLANPDVNKVANNNPKLKSNIDLLKQGWSRLTAEMQADINKDNPDLNLFITNLLTHKLHFGLTYNPDMAKDVKAAENNEMVDLAAFGHITMGIEVANKEEAQSIINKLEEFIQKSGAGSDDTGSGSLQINDVTIQNQPITKITAVNPDDPSQKAEFAITNFGDRLVVVTSDLKTMEDAISRNQNKAVASLTNKTTFLTLISKITEPQWAVFYADSEKTLQLQTSLSQMSDLSEDQSGQAMMQMQKDILNNPYFKSQTVSAINLSDKGIHFTSYFKPTTPGVISSFRNANQTLANIVPEGVLMFTENFDIVSQIAPMAELIAYSISQQINTALGKEGDVFKEWEQQTGISIKDDIAPLFKDNTAFVVRPLNSLLFPVSLTFLSNITDATKAKSSMDKITQVFMKQIAETAFSSLLPPDLKKEDISGVTINSYGEMMPGEAMYNYAFMNSDKLLAISSSTAALKDILNTLTGTNSLAKSAKYPEFLKKQTSTANISFVDIKAIVDIALPFITDLMPEEEKASFDRDIKPYLNVFHNIAGYTTVMNDVIKSEGMIQMVE